MTQELLQNKKIAVVGIGGVGGYMAGMLLRKFPEITTLCARGKRAEAIKEHGLVMHSDYKGESVGQPVSVVDSSELTPQDYIFLCVKNYSLEEACAQIAGAVTEDTVIIPVMNGADPGPRTREFLKKGTVLDTVIYIVSFSDDKYEIIQQGNYAYLRMGLDDPDEIEKQKIKEVAEILSAADIDYKVSEDIQADIWRKYIFNCAYNVITAFYDNDIGQLRRDEQKREEFERLIYEGFHVAQAKNIAISQADIDHMLYRFRSELPDNATSSLQRDLNAGNMAEIDTFGGYLVREAEKYGVEAPVSLRMYQNMRK